MVRPLSRPLFLVLVALGLAAPAAAERVVFQNYTGDDGLSQLSGNVLLQDRDGWIWIGTQAGLNRHDGIGFTTFGVDDGLANDWINDLAQGEDGTLWIATHGGLSSWRNDGGIRNFELPRGCACRRVYSVEPDGRGGVWCGTDMGLVHHDGRVSRRVATETLHSRVDALLRRADGALLVGSQEGLFLWREGEGLSAIPLPGEGDGEVAALAADPRGGVWVARRRSLLHLAGDRVVERWAEAEGLRGLPLESVTVGADGVVWAGTHRGLHSLKGRALHFIGPEQGLPFHNANDVLVDEEGIVWVAGFGGVAKFLGRPFRTWTQEDGLADRNVRPILRTRDGTLWVGSVGGLSRKVGDRWEVWGPERGLPLLRVLCLAEDEMGTLWLGGAAGLFHLVDGRFVEVEAFRDRGWIDHLAVDRGGTLWVAVRDGGLWRREANGEFARVRVPGQSFTSGRLLAHSDGSLYASGDHGLSRLADGRWTTWTVDDGLEDEDVYYMAEDLEGRVWFGYHSSRGVTRFDGRGFRTFTTEDGLHNMAVYSIGCDRRGRIWLGHARGLDRYDGTRFVNYGKAEGYPSQESNSAGFWEDPDGTLWFGTAEGLSEFDPEAELPLDAAPGVSLLCVCLGGETVPADEATFDHDQNDLHVRVRVHSHLNRRRVELRYRLVGSGDRWEPLKGSEIHIPHLAPGHYRLAVQARKYGGDWSPTASVEWTIRSPLWETLGFRIGVGLLTLAAAFGFYRLRMIRYKRHSHLLRARVDERTAELQAQNERLEETLRELRRTQGDLEDAYVRLQSASEAKSRFVANMSHEIRTPMNGVIGMTALLEGTALTEEQQEFVGIIRSSGEALLGTINDILDFSKIEAGRLELEQRAFSLLECVESALDVVAPRAAERGLELVARVAPDTPEQVVGDITRLRQVLVNLLGNAVKFTERGEVVLSVAPGEPQPEGDRLHFSVRDTGIGIPREKLPDLFECFSQVDCSTTREFGGTGLGLAICKRLVQRMGGSIAVESELDVGTEFRFTLWLPFASSGSAPPEAMLPHGRRILLVVANRTLRETLSQQLAGWELRVESVDPEGALARAEEADLALVDRHLPGVDGLALATRLRSRAPVLLLAPVGHYEDPEAARLDGCLLKPLKRDQLRRALAECLRSARGTEEATMPSGRRRRAGGRPLRILLAEDNPVNQRVALLMLRQLGHDADLAENGEQVVRAQEEVDYDLVLMDVHMPVMDGMEAARKIRESRPQGAAPWIVALTANAMNEDRERCLEAGMDDFLGKPVRLEELAEALERCPQPAGSPA